MFKKIYLALIVLVLLVTAAFAEENTQVKHYLLLGEDGYAEELSENARTDTVILLSLDEKYNRVIMTSILRDSKIDNPRGNETKVNLLFKFHGLDGVISCLERELDLEIEGAVLINFENVKPVIDALGGVDIEIDINEFYAIRNILLNDDPNLPEKPGLVHMTGRIALAYMRDRSSGSGDFSRAGRQRKVVSALVEKCKKLSLMELIGIYNQVSSGMMMNLSALDVLGAMRSGYALIEGDADFVEHCIPEKGTYYYGEVAESSAMIVNWERNKEILHALIDGEGL